MQFYRGRTLDIITQVETVDGFGSRLVGDYGRYTTGCAVLETAERLAVMEGLAARMADAGLVQMTPRTERG